MNKTLKWILIGLAIAVGVFLIATPVFYVIRHAGNLGDLRQGMMPFRSGSHMPFRPGLMMIPLMGLFGLFRVALPLAVIGFAVYGVVALVRGRKPAISTAAQAVPPLPVVPASDRNCAACGKPLPGEGEFCPFCGAKQ